MDEAFSRFSLLLGEDSIQTLQQKRVMVFGLGGVGGSALEALVRAGVGEFDLIDSDEFSISNLNRQALSSFPVLGRKKVDVAKERVLAINPNAIVHTYDHFYLPNSPGDIDISKADIVIDAIDTVSAKLDIISYCDKHSIPMVSALGCGNRMDPTKLVITEIEKTEMDPLAKVIRKKCREMGVRHLRVVYSTEMPSKTVLDSEENGRHIPGSSPFVPPVAGIMMAFEAVNILLDLKKRCKTPIN